MCPFGPLSEWRFDECKYDGTVDEVIDSSGNGRHAQTHNGVTSEDYAQIERSVYFDGVDDYVEQNDLYDLLKGTASLSFWIKTTQSGNDIPYNAPGVSGVEENVITSYSIHYTKLYDKTYIKRVLIYKIYRKMYKK